MTHGNTPVYTILKEAVINRGTAAVLTFFVAFYPLSVGLQAVFGSVWEIPILASVYAVYLTLAFTIPAALTVPITETVIGTNLYYAGLGTTVAALATSYLVLSIGIAGAFRTIRARLVR